MKALAYNMEALYGVFKPYLDETVESYTFYI